MSEGTADLGDVANRIRDAGQDGKITVHDVVEALGSRSHFAMLLVISATAATPLSGIPGVSILCGLLIALVAAERIVLRGDIYLPGKVRHRALAKDKVLRVLDKAQPVIDFIDRHTRRRMSPLFKAPIVYFPLLLCVVSGLTMPFLEFIPFSSSIVATGVLFISVGFVTRDGIIALLSVVPYVGLFLLLTRVL